MVVFKDRGDDKVCESCEYITEGCGSCVCEY